MGIRSGSADHGLLLRLVLAELDAGRSLAGALARVVAACPDERYALLLSDGDQIAAAAWGEPLHVLDLGNGEYVLAARPDPPAIPPRRWAELPQGTVLLVDPCGLTPGWLGTPPCPHHDQEPHR